MDTLDYRTLDPGIRMAVMLLRAEGFDTTDSGDGRTKPNCGVATSDGIVCNLDFPHVVAQTSRSKLIPDAERMLRLLQNPAIDTGITGWVVEASFSPNTGTCVLLARGDALGGAGKGKQP